MTMLSLQLRALRSNRPPPVMSVSTGLPSRWNSVRTGRLAVNLKSFGDDVPMGHCVGVGKFWTSYFVES